MDYREIIPHGRVDILLVCLDTDTVQTKIDFMKSKIFNALKQEFSKLGLGDDVLQADADSLASTGLITDDNLATVVKGRESALKVIQSSIDKERTQKATLQKQHDEYKAAHPEAGGDPNKNEPKNDLDTKIAQAVAAAMKPVTDELAGYKAKEKVSARQSTIAEKCTALGIPAWRQQEGFAIAEDADEATIDTYLAGVKKNITTNALPTNESSLALSTNEKQLTELAEASVNNLPDIK